LKLLFTAITVNKVYEFGTGSVDATFMIDPFHFRRFIWWSCCS